MSKSLNPNLIVSNRSYTTEKICTIYKSQKLHPQTVRGFIKNEGLKVVSMKPIVILGKDLKEFLKRRNAHKKTLAFNEFKCPKCKAISEPQNKEISIYYNKNRSIRAVGICGVCPAEMQRFYSVNDEEKVRKFFLVKLKLSTLCNSSYTTLQTNIKTNEEAPQNEYKTEEKCGKVLEKEVQKVCLATQTSQSINLALQTNIKKKGNVSRTALHTNINQEFQPSLF